MLKIAINKLDHNVINASLVLLYRIINVMWKFKIVRLTLINYVLNVMIILLWLANLVLWIFRIAKL